MEGFPGVAAYQKYCRMAVMRDGYILMNPQTRHRCHIPDLPFIREMQEKMDNMSLEDNLKMAGHMVKPSMIKQLNDALQKIKK